jgi:hypothetical protein
MLARGESRNLPVNLAQLLETLINLELGTLPLSLVLLPFALIGGFRRVHQRSRQRFVAIEGGLAFSLQESQGGREVDVGTLDHDHFTRRRSHGDACMLSISDAIRRGRR